MVVERSVGCGLGRKQAKAHGAGRLTHPVVGGNQRKALAKVHTANVDGIKRPQSDLRMALVKDRGRLRQGGAVKGNQAYGSASDPRLEPLPGTLPELFRNLARALLRQQCGEHLGQSQLRRMQHLARAILREQDAVGLGRQQLHEDAGIEIHRRFTNPGHRGPHAPARWKAGLRSGSGWPQGDPTPARNRHVPRGHPPASERLSALHRW